MQIVRIQCPKCKVTLDVKDSTGAEQKTIECPRCKARLIVKFKQDNEKTYYDSRFNPSTGRLDQSTPPPAPQKREEDPGTKFMNAANFWQMGKLLFGTTVYPLQLGVNTIGRKANTSSASVQIDTQDRSMSRSHAVIEVSKLYDGRIHTVIRNSNNKNPTFVGGQPLIDDDRIILNNGDIIQMGEVTLTFVQ
ncbi:MAG: FHA domain-containing protein [Prevotella sp.]|nr:FHA domain-containing protein [Prevotella sp.]MCR5152589.1 FHA domain-containing protein [Prevotella sp.]